MRVRWNRRVKRDGLLDLRESDLFSRKRLRKERLGGLGVDF